MQFLNFLEMQEAEGDTTRGCEGVDVEDLNAIWQILRQTSTG